MQRILPESRQIIRNGVFVALVWTALICFSLIWEIHAKRQQSDELALHEAAAYISRDIAFRDWAASHGGVYVPPSATTPPNPYLADVPDRDLVSATGKRLTLMNPAYMLREVQSRSASALWGKARITSLKPLNPLNAPDDWEKSALLRLERGAGEVAEFVDSGAQLRLMRPIRVQQACLKCHLHQGYKEGDLRGGIAVSLNMEPFLASARDSGMKSAANHGLIWLFGLVSIGYLTRRAQRREIESTSLQRELRDSEERFRSITTSALDAIIMMDDRGRVIYWNPAAESFFGYRAEEAIAQDVHDLIMPRRFADDFQRGFEHYLASGTGPAVSRTLELTALHRDGSEFPVELSVSTTLLEGRRHAIGIVRDISARKQAEQALRASEERLNEAQRIAHIGSWELDLVSGKLHWSDEIFRIFGIDSTRFGASYASFLDAVHPDDRERVDQAYRESVANRVPYEIDHRLLMQDGTVKWVHERGRTFYGAQGKPHSSLGTVQDISERKQAELEMLRYRTQLEELVKVRTQELSESLAQIRDSEQRQRLMLERLPVGVVLSSGLEQKMLYQNPCFVEMLGYTVEEIPYVAQLWPAAFPDPEYREKIIPEWNRRIAAAIEHKTEIEPMEFAITTKHGKVKHVSVHAAVIGEFNFITLIDLTARKQAEMRLQELNATLEQRVAEEVAKNMEHERLLIQQSRLAAMGEMVHNIAHQWRQPLSTVGLILQNIALDYDDNLLTSSALHEYADNGKSLIQKMTATIDDFRDFFTPQREKVDFPLRQAVDSALNIVHASFLNHGIDIVLAPSEDAQVCGYPNEFSQVLLNLLGNAKDVILERKIQGGKIDIALGQDEERAWVIVGDNGGGIADGILAKIFDPYFTTKEKGTGIGLYMSRMIMSHMDGALEARNREGGAEFRASVPKSPRF